MSHITPSRVSKAYAVVAGLTIVTIGGLEGYTLSQGIDGNASTASLARLRRGAGLGGARIGRLLK